MACSATGLQSADCRRRPEHEPRDPRQHAPHPATSSRSTPPAWPQLAHRARGTRTPLPLARVKRARRKPLKAHTELSARPAPRPAIRHLRAHFTRSPRLASLAHRPSAVRLRCLRQLPPSPSPSPLLLPLTFPLPLILPSPLPFAVDVDLAVDVAVDPPMTRSDPPPPRPPFPVPHYRSWGGGSDHAHTTHLSHLFGGGAWSDPPPPTPTQTQSQEPAAGRTRRRTGQRTGRSNAFVLWPAPCYPTTERTSPGRLGHRDNAVRRAAGTWPCWFKRPRAAGLSPPD